MTDLEETVRNHNNKILNDIKETSINLMYLKDCDLKEIPKDAEDTAEQIRENLVSLGTDDFNLLLSLHKKTLTNEKIIRDLLNHELIYFKPKNKISDKQELVNLIKKLIKRYEYCLCNSIYEDSDWIVKYESDRKFKSNENQIMILNTLKEEYVSDTQTEIYLNNLINNFKRYVNENEIHMKFKVWEDEDNNVFWIIFVITDMMKNK